MAQFSGDRWRGQIEQKVETLVKAVGDNEKGLVHDVLEIKLIQARMAVYGALASFAGSIISAVLVALAIKYFV